MAYFDLSKENSA